MKPDAFEVEEILVDSACAVAAGSADPVADALVYPPGSLYLRSNGEVWRKGIGPATDWVQLDAIGIMYVVPEGGTLVIHDGFQHVVQGGVMTLNGDVYVDGSGELIVNE